MRSLPFQFILTSLLLAATLVPGAFLRGEVLSQSSLLFQYPPWQGHAPADAATPNPLLSDPAIVFYPLLTHTVATVQRWALPLWNASLYAGGHPFLASFQTAVFSPFTAIAYVIPLPFATVPMALTPLVVGGTGMWLFIRSLGLGTAAAWFGGLAYLANGFAVGWMEHPLTGVACWLPWVLRASDAVVRHGRRGAAAGLAAFVALVVLCGHPETAAKVLLLASAYAATALLLDRPRHWRPLLAAYVAGILLTALQVLPFVEYLSQSQAWRSREVLTANPSAMPVTTLIAALVPGSREVLTANPSAMPVTTLIAALVPDFWGHPTYGTYMPQFNRFGVASNYAEQALYAGIAVILLAPAALVGRRDWRVGFFAVAAVLALALMFGLPGVLHAASALPLLRVTMLSRFGLIAIVSTIVLAAYVVDALVTGAHEQTRAVSRTVTVTAAVLLGVIGMASMVAQALPGTPSHPGGRTAAVATAMLLLVAVSALAALRSSGVLGPVAFSFTLCSILAADLIVAHRGLHPTMPARQVYPPVPELDLVARDPGLFRVYGWGEVLVPNTAMAYGLQDVRGWDGMNPDRYTRLLDLGYLRQSRSPATHLANPTLLDLLNVKYVFAGADVPLAAPRYAPVPGTQPPLYVNTRALPRAFLVNRYRVLDDAAMQRTLHAGTTDLAREVLLEQDLSEAERPQKAAGPGAVQVQHYRHMFVQLRVRADARSLLVLSDAYYPGWIATVDGARVQIRRADFALRAVAVPAGDHIVEFEYRPWSVTLGAATSALTALALGAWCLFPFRRHRFA